MSAFTWCRIAVPVAALLGATVAGAFAQAPMLPWPDQKPQQPQQRPWPGDAQQAAAPPAAAPMAPMAPMTPAPGMGAPAMGMPPPGGPAAECLKEFTRLRGEVEKRGAVAKSVNDRKGGREEMCSAISGIYSAQVNWVKYTQSNYKRCGIPPDVVAELKKGQSHLAQLRKNVCSAGPATAAAPAAPSLSEALGTARLPVSSNDESSKRGGVLDTMTGTAIR